MYSHDSPNFYNVYSDSDTDLDYNSDSDIYIDGDNDTPQLTKQSGGEYSAIKSTPEIPLAAQTPPVQYQFTSYLPPKPQKPQVPLDKPFIIGNPERLLQKDKLNIMAPVINNIVLNPSDPFQDHAMIAPFVELMLPINNAATAIATIKDRKLLAEFIKNTLLFNEDGLVVDSVKYNIKQLMHSIKTTRLNPYVTPETYGKVSPYDMPQHFIIYRSCFPIKFVQNGIKCDSKSSMVNMRFYQITRGELLNRRDDKVINNSKALSEIKFYDYIKNNIILTNECPNFTLMYGYNYYNDPDIQFDAYRQKKDVKKATSLVAADITMDEFDKIDQKLLTTIKNYFNGIGYSNILDVIPEKDKKIIYNNAKAYGLPDNDPTFEKISTYLLIKYLASFDKFIKKQITTQIHNETIKKQYLNDFALMMTESPNYSIYDWASKRYIDNIGVRTMTNTGYHSYYQWLSVIFQMLCSFSTLLTHHIFIPNFTLANNVFIKIIPEIPSNPKVWKYIINGIEYYVPNFGDFVMVDSSFVDTNDNNDSIILDDTENQTKMYDSLIECLNPINFSSSIFMTRGGSPPDDDVIAMIEKLYNFCLSSPKKDINVFKKAINHNIFEFINNRIGTELTEDEYQNIQSQPIESITPDTKPGKLIIYKTGSKYKIGIYIKDEDIIEVKDTPDTKKDNSIVGGYFDTIHEFTEDELKEKLNNTNIKYNDIKLDEIKELLKYITTEDIFKDLNDRSDKETYSNVYPKIEFTNDIIKETDKIQELKNIYSSTSLKDTLKYCLTCVFVYLNDNNYININQSIQEITDNDKSLDYIIENTQTTDQKQTIINKNIILAYFINILTYVIYKNASKNIITNIYDSTRPSIYDYRLYAPLISAVCHNVSDQHTLEILKKKYNILALSKINDHTNTQRLLENIFSNFFAPEYDLTYNVASDKNNNIMTYDLINNNVKDDILNSFTRNTYSYSIIIRDLLKIMKELKINKQIDIKQINSRLKKYNKIYDTTINDYINITLSEVSDESAINIKKIMVLKNIQKILLIVNQCIFREKIKFIYYTSDIIIPDTEKYDKNNIKFKEYINNSFVDKTLTSANVKFINLYHFFTLNDDINKMSMEEFINESNNLFKKYKNHINKYINNVSNIKASRNKLNNHNINIDQLSPITQYNNNIDILIDQYRRLYNMNKDQNDIQKLIALKLLVLRHTSDNKKLTDDLFNNIEANNGFNIIDIISYYFDNQNEITNSNITKSFYASINPLLLDTFNINYANLDENKQGLIPNIKAYHYSFKNDLIALNKLCEFTNNVYTNLIDPLISSIDDIDDRSIKDTGTDVILDETVHKESDTSKVNIIIDNHTIKEFSSDIVFLINKGVNIKQLSINLNNGDRSAGSVLGVFKIK